MGLWRIETSKLKAAENVSEMINLKGLILLALGMCSIDYNEWNNWKKTIKKLLNQCPTKKQTIGYQKWVKIHIQSLRKMMSSQGYMYSNIEAKIVFKFHAIFVVHVCANNLHNICYWF